MVGFIFQIGVCSRMSTCSPPTVAVIKSKLSALGLPVNGSKRELLSRLTDWDTAGGLRAPERAREAVRVGIQVRREAVLAEKEKAMPMDVVTLEMTWVDVMAIFTGWALVFTRNLLLMATNRKHKKMRNANFPSDCSENLAKFTYLKIFGTRPNWNTLKGDLTVIEGGELKRIEVKGETWRSGGPVSFGKTEQWDFMMFVRLAGPSGETPNRLQVTRINLSNREMRGLMLDGQESYGEACDRAKGQRPRACMDTLLADPSFEGKLNVLFDGTVERWR